MVGGGTDMITAAGRLSDVTNLDLEEVGKTVKHFLSSDCGTKVWHIEQTVDGGKQDSGVAYGIVDHSGVLF